MTIAPHTVSRLKDVVGPAGFSEDPAEIAPHLEEWRGKYHGQAKLLLKPKNTQETAAILAICNETRTPIVPQGGDTGLVGGQIPFHNEVLLSLTRMNRIRAVDADGMSMIVEAGVVLAEVQRVADEAGRYFPLSLASEGSCTIGGNLSTNAGGVNVLRYGNAREQVLGLEVVLADGRVLDLLRTLRKDNTGYDLKQMFIGAEGTLGVITAAALKLYPRPAQHSTAFVAVPDVKAAIALLGALQHATGGQISAFELVPRIGLDFVLAHMAQTKDPLPAGAPWYVLAEAAGAASVHLNAAMEGALSDAIERGVAMDAVLAQNESQRTDFWKIRETLSEAQKFEGGSIKHDVSVPIGRLAEFLETATHAVLEQVPGARPVPFGHLGDGNIHFNVSVPKGADDTAFLARWDEIARTVHDIVHAFGGSISAEHGIGVMKRSDIARYKSPAEIGAMHALKRAFDPNGILNPGKVLPDEA